MDYYSYKAGKTVVYFFIFSLCISFIYAFFWGKYNGDFGDDVQLKPAFLFLNLIISTIPFLVLLFFYRYFKFKFQSHKIVYVNMYFFEWLIIFLLFWHISISIIFGVNKMGADAYSAPDYFVPIIQIMNRFNPQYIAPLFLLASNNNRKVIFIIIGLIIFAVVRASLGILFVISLLMFVKHYPQIIHFIKKHILIVLIITIVILPFSIKTLYNIRSTLRSSEKIKTDGFSSIIINKFMGRLSSFSNSAILIQEAPYFIINAQYLEDYFFQKTAISVIFSQSYKPKSNPSEILVKYANPQAENSQYMCGTQGILIMSLYKSSKVFFINIMTYILMIYFTFYFAKMIKIEYNLEYALLNMVMFVMSGSPSEYSFFLFTVLLLIFVFALSNSVKILLHNK